MSKSFVANATSNQVFQKFDVSVESGPSSECERSIFSGPSSELSNSLLSPATQIHKIDDPRIPITPEDLKKWARMPEVGVAIAKTLGLPTQGLIETRKVTEIYSPLPGFTGRKPTCGLILSDNDELLFIDFAEQYGKKVFTLPNLAASIAYQKPMKMKGPLFATWRLRLLLDAGLIHPANVPMLPPPEDASENELRIYHGFQYLLRCKWRFKNGFGKPTSFSKEFMSAWCGIPATSAHRAKLKLMEKKVIKMVGVYKKQGRRSCGIFLPWTGDSHGT